MLQIISGKFFGEGKINEREADAVLYSNFSCFEPIPTSVAELRPVGFGHAPISTFVVRYVNRYQPSKGDVLVQPVDREAVEQFRLLLSFWLKAFFHPDLNYVETLCRKHPRHSVIEIIPSAFVPHFFDLRKHATAEQVPSLIGFVTKVIGMPRRQYRLFLSCLATFFDALEAINVNFDLAYSMFVYLLEALSKDEQYTPSWGDYEQGVRDKLDRAFRMLRPSTVDAIRGVLLDGAQLKLTSRFLAFVTRHVDDRFFRAEAVGLQRPLRKSTLQQALRNLYQTRSGFVHQLDRVHEQLRLPQFGDSSDTFEWQNQPYLTMSGLVRLTHHVLCEFANRQPFLEKEEYPWRNEIPGIIQAEMAPQYWIWQVEGFKAQHSKHRFSGFMDYLVTHMREQPIKLPDLRPLMERIEEIAGQASAADRIPMLAIYFVFNSIIPAEHRRPNYEAVLKKYGSDGDQCTIEVVASSVVLGMQLKWNADACAEAFANYERHKYKATSVNLPPTLEVAIEAKIANRFLAEQNVAEFERWSMKASLDAAGAVDIQRLLDDATMAKAEIDVRRIFGIQTVERADDSHATAQD